MDSNPLGQAIQLLQLAKDQKVTDGELQKLFHSPCLSVLFKAAQYQDFSTIDQGAFVNDRIFQDTDTLLAELRTQGFAIHKLISLNIPTARLPSKLPHSSLGYGEGMHNGAARRDVEESSIVLPKLW